jgi:hypothetical protein
MRKCEVSARVFLMKKKTLLMENVSITINYNDPLLSVNELNVAWRVEH